MAGYSPTPQARKLGLKPGVRFEAIEAPDGWALTDPPPLEPAGMPAGGTDGADGTAGTDGGTDVLLHFVRAAVEVVPALEAAAPRIFPAGAVWVAWPRRAAGHVSDVSENAIRDAALARGLVDVKVAAIDDDWSGLKIVWRVENRDRKSVRGSVSNTDGPARRKGVGTHREAEGDRDARDGAGEGDPGERGRPDADR